jgi:hypothetical protein
MNLLDICSQPHFPGHVLSRFDVVGHTWSRLDVQAMWISILMEAEPSEAARTSSSVASMTSSTVSTSPSITLDEQFYL